MARSNVTRTITDAVYSCDFCGSGSKVSWRCSICGRDCCQRHLVLDPDDYSDYPTKYCQECWERPEREAFYAYKLESEKRLDELEQEWMAACKPQQEVKSDG